MNTKQIEQIKLKNQLLNINLELTSNNNSLIFNALTAKKYTIEKLLKIIEKK
jgi:hypothetical protein